MLLQLLSDFAKRHPWLIVANFLFMAFAPINDVVLPHMYGKLIHAIQHSPKKMGYYVTVIICLFVIVQIGAAGFDLHDAYMNPAFQGHLREHMTETILKIHDGNHKEATTGDIISRFVKAPEILIHWFTISKDFMIPYMFTYTTTAFYFYKHDPALGLALAATIIIVAMNLFSSPSRCKSEALDMTREYSSIYEEFDDMVRNMLSIFSASQMEAEMKRYGNQETAFSKAYKKLIMCGLRDKVLSFTVLISFFIFFMHRCHKLILSKKMDTSSFIAMFMMFTTMISSLFWLVDIIRDVIVDSGMIRETVNILSEPPASAAPPRSNLPTGSAPATPGFGFWHVGYSYPGAAATNPILKDVHVHVNPGERVAIVGENGSGKSTLLKLLLRFIQPSAGDMYIHGRWYHTLSQDDVRKSFGYIPQNAILFNRSILDNILYGNPHVTPDQAIEYVESLGLMQEFQHFEDGIHHLAGKHGSHLSGGQRQLIWALRTLLRQPQVLVMDEPTASLDDDTKHLLLKMIDTLGKGITVIVVSHDPYLLKHMSRHIRIENGKVAGSDDKHQFIW